LKILVVVHESLVPPESVAGLTDQQVDEWRTEYDVIRTLRLVGHEVRVQGVLDSLTGLRVAITEWKPDVVFNLLEEFNGIVTYDQHVVAYLELMQQPYTGCNPRGLLLSLGIAQASVVDTPQQLQDRVAFIHEQVGTDALVEEFIAGREVYVGVLGNERLTRLPVWELQFGSMAASQSAIATRKVKWDRSYQQRHGIVRAAAQDLPPAVLAKLDRMSRRIYRALGLSGYARMDFRLRDDGEVFVLEANANPCLAEAEDFSQSALSAGIGYQDLLNRIITIGLAYKAEWRAGYG
jgi:D-alanine-D-alanine ligase